MSVKDKHLFTSESVTEGHPDKVCDQISDAVLDEILKEDPSGRVACETMVTTGMAIVAGEITTSCYVDIPKVARNTIREIGYTSAEYGFDYLTCGVMTSIQTQSPDIAMGVDTGGAGDQGMMFGYATDETKEFMPMPISLAHALTRRLARIRKESKVDYLRPDGKSQVTVEYDNGKPKRIEAVVISAHHDKKVKMSNIHADMKKLVIKPVIPGGLIDRNTKIFINPTGRFEVGGPQGDTGVTGRKIIVDTYGGVGSHGGGAFSGKDPSKVDRSASYMARYIAKNIVAAGIARRCEVQLAYAIGVAEPVSVMVNTFGTGKISDSQVVKLVRETFDLTPSGIIEDLQLRRPIYKRTATYGHFGRQEEGFTWEEVDKVKILKKNAK
ncbi:MAG: methionine adenosyltransferase [Candidatus Omnitrophica bacterium]|nr:methionine adenosyltransferase [Candidatus Omnitrophota bacterium]MBU1127651.1 methionine adenosyltransferase [Candidatus Omnitrophota bacterium]MBU1784934.1 methionine adenosyltransferase [Candidatus Omnitrophota bacterium]MBU1851969.1 methionine adenosyltransferase [Candidatus Omnitrophota bacterium]